MLPWADGVGVVGAYAQDYDVDAATGSQLDTVGTLVGIGRTIETPLTGVYFSLDTPGLGLDAGVFQGPTDPSSGINVLADDAFRLLIRARIANNHWDGSLQGAYTLSAGVFSSLGYQLFIQDNSDMTISLGLLPLLNFAQVQDGSASNLIAPTNNVVINYNPVGAPGPIVQALMQGGYLDLRPATVKISSYIWPQQAGSIFAFDIVNDYFDGFDRGQYAGVAYTGVPKIYPLLFAFDLSNDVRAGFDDAVWMDASNS